MTRRAPMICLALALALMLGIGLGACGSGGGASVASFCALVKKDHDSFSGAGKVDLARADDAMKQLVGKSPAAVKPDVKVLAAYFDDLAKGRQTAAVAGSENTAVASNHLEAYVKAQCKFDLTPTT